MSSNASRNAIFIDEMGLGPLWKRRPVSAEQAVPAARIEPTAAPASPFETAPSAEVRHAVALSGTPTASAGEIAGMDWIRLKDAVTACTKCDLCHGRTQTVFGVGDEKAKWLFVGEGPGRNEDRQGLPFVGPAGKLLDNMLQAMGLKRGANAYIANIVKCRPTDADGRDRPPTPEESAACLPYLERQIALIQPAIIVALGKTAALSLLKLDPATPVSKLRGSVHRYAGLPLVVTYHPAYLLRNLVDKRKTWDDLCLAMQSYAGTVQ